MKTVREVRDRFLKNQRGTVIPAVALSVVAFLGMGGLVIDGGRLFFTKRQMQGAADAGALAAAMELKRGLRDLQADLRPAAVNDTSLNGYNEDNSLIIVNHPPQSGRFSGDSDHVEVLIQREVETTFAQVFHHGPTTVVARGVAGLVDLGAKPDECIIALNRYERAAFRFHGNPDIEANCGMMANSTNAAGLEFNGGISVKATYIGYNDEGGYRINGGSGNIEPTPVGALPVEDPLADLEPPNSSGWEVATYNKKSNKIKCDSGRCVFPSRLQITSSKKAIEFPPGIYVLKDGMNLSAKDPITGHGVMFYSEGSKGIRIGGNGDVTFTPPTEGDYKGILLFGSRDQHGVANNVGRGNAEFIWKGVLYFPTQHLDFSGTFYGEHQAPDPNGDGTGTWPWGIIITDTLDFGGTTDMKFNLPPKAEAPKITKVLLTD